MKKGTIIALIAAAILIVAGGILLMLGLSFAGDSVVTPMPAEKSYVVDAPFESIRVETATCNVDFQKTDGSFKVSCPDSEKFSYTVTVEENTLCVRQVDLRRWYDFIDIHLKEEKITLYLPENQYNLLRIDTDTGDIRVAEDFSFSTAEIFTDTGDVRFSASVSERFNASASTGDLTICAGTPEIVHVNTSTGDVELENMACGDCFVKTTTGNLFISSLTCQTLDCQSNTGDKFLQNVVAEDYIKAISTTGDVNLDGVLLENYLQIFTTTGDVEIETSDAGSINIETDTGRVSGSFLSSKCFLVYSNTGNISVPQTREGGECRIETDTGDIIFS